MDISIFDEIIRIVGFLTLATGVAWCMIRLIQKLDRYLTKRSLVKDVIRKAKIEYKDKNK